MNSATTALLGTILIATLLVASGPLQAETIRVPVGQQGSGETLATPRVGMSADTVLQQFGEPAERLPAKGKPPINRWIYARFVVYFESSTVIHTVVKHRGRIEP